MEHRATYRSVDENKHLLLNAAAKLFLKKGYSATTLREIAGAAKVNIGSLMHAYENKESILADLIPIVLHGQFQFIQRLLRGKTEDPVLRWGTEVVLQLYMAESNEALRELYLTAYSLSKPSFIIYQYVSEKLQMLFQSYFPDYEGKDFYELEIASGGIIRSFMSVPCDLYFDVNRKIRRYLEVAFRLYKLPEEKAAEAFRFVSSLGLSGMTEQFIDMLLQEVEKQLSLSP